MRTKLTIDLQHFYRHLRSQKINYEVLKGDDFFVESIKVGKWIYYNDDGIIKEIIDYSKE